MRKWCWRNRSGSGLVPWTAVAGIHALAAARAGQQNHSEVDGAGAVAVSSRIAVEPNCNSSRSFVRCGFGSAAVTQCWTLPSTLLGLRLGRYNNAWIPLRFHGVMHLCHLLAAAWRNLANVRAV